MNGSGSAELDCPLCGARFAADARERPCAGCPLGGGCELACCPNCGYAFPRASRTVDWIRRLLGKRSPAP